MTVCRDQDARPVGPASDPPSAYWLISRRTAVINQLRAFLRERGTVFAQTPAKLKGAMTDILENAEADLTR